MQPVDQGLIRVCKLQYHTLTTQKFLRLVVTEDDVKEIMGGLDITVACANIVAAQNYVSDKLIIKCFHKAGYLISVPTAPEPEKNIWDNLERVLNVQVPYETYVTADDHMETSKTQQG